jgi:Xaa-Pro aminopeptidase
MSTSIPARIAALRAAMAKHGIAACLVPTADPHLSEYLPGHWQAREWLSGFTGSAGTLLVTANEAGLWTDSRYFSQAEQQLAGSGVALMKQRISHAPEHLTWLQQHLHQGDVIAVAGDSVSVGTQRNIAPARRRRNQTPRGSGSARHDLDRPPRSARRTRH